MQYRARPAGLWCCGRSRCVSLCADGVEGLVKRKEGLGMSEAGAVAEDTL